MKTFRWNRILPFALILVAAAPQSKASKPDWTGWNTWSAFPEGAWVTMEKDNRGEFKTTFTLTLTKKTPDLLAVKEDVEKKKDDKNADDQPPLVLPVPGFENGEWHYARNPKPIVCPTCGASHKDSIVTEQKKDKLTIAGKEVLCQVMDVVTFECKGAKDSTSRWWWSKEVPGWLVKREYTAEGRPGKVVETVLDFDKKKKVTSEGQ
jgi:hypothetical protein